MNWIELVLDDPHAGVYAPCGAPAPEGQLAGLGDPITIAPLTATLCDADRQDWDARSIGFGDAST